MNNSPPNFNISKNDSTPNFKKSLKKVKFDKSVDIQQIELKEEKEHQKRIQAVLDEQSMNERIEQLKIDEMFRRTNGIPFEGNFGSPIPMDPFQKKFGNSSPSSNLVSPIQPLKFGSSKFGSDLSSPSATNFASSEINSKPRRSGLYKLQATRFKSSVLNENIPSNNSFSTSKGFSNSRLQQFNNSIQSSNIFKSSGSQPSNMFRSSFKSLINSNNGFGNSFYKTKLCFEYRETQQCINGINCRYAHGIDELRLPPVLPTQKICNYILRNLQCPFGLNCKFLHHF